MNISCRLCLFTKQIPLETRFHLCRPIEDAPLLFYVMGNSFGKYRQFFLFYDQWSFYPNWSDFHGLTVNRDGSLQMCPINKTVLKKFTILTGKHLSWSLFWRHATLLRRDSDRCFPENIAKIFKNILKNICEWLLLKP